MPRTNTILVLTTAAALLGMAGVGVAHPHDAEVEQLRKENADLKESLVASNKAEKESAESLATIRLRLEALGKNLIDGGNDRLVQAVTDLEVMNRRVREMEESALRLSGTVQGYMKTAVASDPEQRALVEASLRELEALVGLRNQPRRKVEFGNMQHAKVVSIDGSSGLVVLNIGEKAGSRIGMVFQIKRGETVIGEAVVALTDKDVSGLLVQTITDQNNPVRLHDVAALKVD
ncbi:MAG: hypothetical protein O3A87_02740 [Verrucomicrobia bacterium]|mgnify:CR=1 FL=1|jgi:hypothetical protein|nr:hypothetical protein [Verrucomicrobiota bacterium]MDA1005384.1 hypothetical protein [Verrucomicrobiota bacterium]